VVKAKGPISPQNPEKSLFRAIQVIAELKKGRFFAERDRNIVPPPGAITQEFPRSVFRSPGTPLRDEPDTRIQFHKGFLGAVLDLPHQGIPFQGNDIPGFIAFFLGIQREEVPKKEQEAQEAKWFSHGFGFTLK